MNYHEPAPVKSARLVIETEAGQTHTFLVRNPAQVGFSAHTTPPSQVELSPVFSPVFDDERYEAGFLLVARLHPLYDNGPKIVRNDYAPGGYDTYVANRIHEVLRARYGSLRVPLKGTPHSVAAEIAALVAEMEGRS